MLNIFDLDNDIDFLKEDLASTISRAEYDGKRVLAVPRCCQRGWEAQIVEGKTR